MVLLPQHDLILEHFHPTKDASVLLLEGGDGGLAERIADLVPDGRVLTLAHDLRDFRSAQKHLVDIKNASTASTVFPDKRDWKWVILTIPKGRRYARSLLMAAWKSLEPGGKLLLAGPTRKGAKAVISDAERLFGNSLVLGYRKHQRVAVSVKGDCLPDPLPEAFQSTGIAPGTTRIIEITLPEGTLSFETHPGIFSWEALDEGTGFLLENFQINSNESVWDVGCGYGILGLAAAVKGASRVLMTDVNLIAITYASKNILHNQLVDRVFTASSVGLELPSVNPPITRFDLIISNPAFHQGRNVDKSMSASLFSSTSGMLSPRGRVVIVANRFLNYQKDLSKYFQVVTTIAENGKYQVIQAHNE